MTAINEHAGISGTAAFHPPVRTLMGPGPSDVSPQVLAAMARPTIGHLDPEFVRLMDEIKGLLQYAFVTKNQLTIPISAPGSAGMEACFVNLVGPGDTVIVCVNGVGAGAAAFSAFVSNDISHNRLLEEIERITRELCDT